MVVAADRPERRNDVSLQIVDRCRQPAQSFNDAAPTCATHVPDDADRQLTGCF